MAVEIGDGGDPGGILFRDSGHAAGTIARFLFDEQRWPGPEGVLGSASALSHALQIEHALLRVYRTVRGVPSGGHRGRDDEHWNAVCVRAGLHWRVDPAATTARPAAGLSRAGGPVRFNGGRDRVRRHDLWAGLDELDAAAGVARDWAGDLFQLQSPP